MDYQGLPPVDVLLPVDAGRSRARAATRRSASPRSRSRRSRCAKRDKPDLSTGKLVVNDLVRALKLRCGDRDVTLLAHAAVVGRRAGRSAIRSTISAPTAAAASAAAPACGRRRARAQGSGRLPVAVCGDGDFLMGDTALWTAAHYQIPLLIVVANNRSFFNDELHQERVARMRIAAGGEPLDRPAHRRARHRYRGDGALAGRAGLRPGDQAGRSGGDLPRRRSPRSKPAMSRWSTCGSSPAIRRWQPRRCCAARRCRRRNRPSAGRRGEVGGKCGVQANAAF